MAWIRLILIFISFGHFFGNRAMKYVGRRGGREHRQGLHLAILRSSKLLLLCCILTVGVGHTIKTTESSELTEQEAEELLKKDLWKRGLGFTKS